MVNKLTVIIILIFALIGMSCNRIAKKQEVKDINLDEQIELNNDLTGDLNTAKKVFYALPSPVETVMLLKRAEATYNADFLNPISKVETYTTTYSQAINFGIYGADLCYASLFEQTQTAIDYMGASKKLADNLGVLDFMNNNIMERLEKNINNRDSAMQIITDGFMSSNEFLKENGRSEVAALIIAGGWVEGLYLATRLTREAPNNNELIDRIIDQKLSLNTLISLLENFNTNQGISLILNYTHRLNTIYDKITVVTSKIEPIVDNNAKVTQLQAKSNIFMTDEVFKELCNTVDSVRTILVE